jgi:hypothetical protein
MLIVIATAFGYSGFLCLALAMNRHHQALLGQRPSGARKRLFQLLGTGALIASAVLCFTRWHGGIAFSAWLGVLTIAALAVAITLTYSPRVRSLPFGVAPAGLAFAVIFITATRL